MGFLSFLSGVFTRPPSTPVTKPAGSEGVWAPGGFLVSGERNPTLQGPNKWRAFDNTLANTITVAAMARIWGALLGGAKWVVEPNKRGGAEAERCADLVREGLIEAQMSTPWNSVVRKAGFGSKFRGFAMFEQVLRKRTDGKWITDRLEHRPQHTIEQWDIPDERESWRGVLQRTVSGGEYYLQRERLLYVVDNLIGDSPEGVGILRHCTRHGEQLARFEQLEGWSYEGDLHGVPLGFAPLEELRQAAIASGIPETDHAKIKEFQRVRVQFLDDFLKKHLKNPELSLLLDSSTYRALDDKRTPSDVKKYGVELLKMVSSGQEAVRKAIDGKNREQARLLGMEWLLMGDGEGSRAVHGDKTSMTGLILNGTLEDIGAATTNGPSKRLVIMNGKDPDTCAPRVYPEPVPTETVEMVCNALAALAKAGAPLKPEDIDIVNAVLDRMRLPEMEEPDPADSMLPRIGPDGKPIAGAPPDPSKGEIDVDLDDDEDPTAKRKKKPRRRRGYGGYR